MAVADNMDFTVSPRASRTRDLGGRDAKWLPATRFAFLLGGAAVSWTLIALLGTTLAQLF